MDERIEKFLKPLELGNDQVYYSSFVNKAQEEEIKLRESVASADYEDYLAEIANHHSIPVMDNEVISFLKEIPPNGIVVDVGGCWGWHWRELNTIRPDVTVIIVDFIRANLKHAINILGGEINKNIFLVHGDATQLPFPDFSFE